MKGCELAQERSAWQGVVEMHLNTINKETEQKKDRKEDERKRTQQSRLTAALAGFACDHPNWTSQLATGRTCEPQTSEAWPLDHRAVQSLWEVISHPRDSQSRAFCAKRHQWTYVDFHYHPPLIEASGMHTAKRRKQCACVCVRDSI